MGFEAAGDGAVDAGGVGFAPVEEHLDESLLEAEGEPRGFGIAEEARKHRADDLVLGFLRKAREEGEDAFFAAAVFGGDRKSVV